MLNKNKEYIITTDTNKKITFLAVSNEEAFKKFEEIMGSLAKINKITGDYIYIYCDLCEKGNAEVIATSGLSFKVEYCITYPQRENY